MSKVTSLPKRFAFITKAGAKLDAFIQETAIMTLEHYEEHKNVTILCQLYGSLSAGMRKAAMAEWILAFGAVVVNPVVADRKTKPFVNCAEKVNDIEGGTAKAWFTCKPDPEVGETFDFQKFARTALKKYGTAKTTSMTPEQAHALAALAGVPDSDVPTRPVKAQAEPTVDSEEPLNSIA